jgi:PadR family transcriptional regulator, regulatory protein PadR
MLMLSRHTMRPDLVRGHLELLVLSVVGSGAAHGYAVVEELRRRSGGQLDIPEGTVYPALYRLEDAGLLASEWLQVGRRRRRVYRLTRRGRKALEGKTSEWRTFARAISDVIGGTA